MIEAKTGKPVATSLNFKKFLKGKKEKKS